MKTIYFDTEFTGLHKNTTLISIGLISDCGKTFYAECIDYDKSQVDDWIKENVISKLHFTDKITASCGGWEEFGDKGNEHLDKCTNALEFSLAKKDWSEFKCIGKTPMIGNRLEDWFAQFGDEKIEIWSDCLAYDWVLFQDIFGNAFKMPKSIFYIPFDLATAFKLKGINPDISREEFAYGDNSVLPPKAVKHNALWDARVMKDCHAKLMLPPYPPTLIELDKSCPVPVFEPTCGECGCADTPNRSFTFSLHKSKNKRCFRQQEHCSKCNFDMGTCEMIFANKEAEKEHRDMLDKAGTKYTYENS